jgi:hypothetical protein
MLPNPLGKEEKEKKQIYLEMLDRNCEHWLEMGHTT